MAKIERYEAKDGTVSYRARVYSHRDENGRQKWQWITRPTKRAVEREVARLKDQKDRGARIATPRESFGEYLERWMKRKAPKLGPKARYLYAGDLRRYVLDPEPGAPSLAGKPLNRLTSDDFELLYAWLAVERDRPLDPKTIENVHRVLRQALAHAVRQHILIANPTDNVELPKRQAEPDSANSIKAMDEATAQRFAEAAKPDRYYAAWMLMLTAGLRPEEVWGLVRDDLDLKRGEVHIRRTLQRVGIGGGWQFGPPKTQRGNRAIRLLPVTVEALREWRKRQAAEQVQHPAYEDDGFVFTQPNGRPIHQDNVRKGNFARICRRARLGEFSVAPPKPKGRTGPAKQAPFTPAWWPYCLRHTFATLAYKNGMPLNVLSKTLGHATEAFTLQVYAHVLPAMDEEAVSVLAAVFPAGETAPFATHSQLSDQPTPIEANSNQR